MPARPRCSTVCVNDPAFAETAVIINEFGEIGLDHLLVKPIRDGMVLLQSGCLCCTLAWRSRRRAGAICCATSTTAASAVPPRDPGDHRARRPRAGAADRDGASLSGHALPARRRDHRGRCGERRGDARRAHGSGEAGRGRGSDRADQDRPARLRRSGRRRRDACWPATPLNPAAPILDAAADEASPDRLLACGLYDPDSQDPRRQALARGRSLCRRRVQITITTTTT